MEPVFSIGGAEITALEIAIGLLLLAVGVLGTILLRRTPEPKTDPVVLALREQLAVMQDHQTALQGRIAQMSDDTAKRGDLFQKALDERLDKMTDRMGRNLSEHGERNAKHLKQLYTRLEVIDRAQENIKSLTGEVSGLQSILSNKQARGAFGETQMQALIEQFLPPQSFTFQATLSNGKRVDALIHLPGDHLNVAVDSKFPLEAWQRMVEAENTPVSKAARQQFGRDCRLHIKAIAEKYLIHGETHDVAIMYLPSEAIYAELHAHFQKIVDDGFQRRVVIVSPTTFMATLHTMRAVLKDAAMQEQAGVILKEVAVLLTDAKRLDDRVQKVLANYRTLGKSLGDVETSTGKIIKRSTKMESLELDEDEDGTTIPVTSPIGEAPTLQ